MPDWLWLLLLQLLGGMYNAADANTRKRYEHFMKSHWWEMK